MALTKRRTDDNHMMCPWCRIYAVFLVWCSNEFDIEQGVVVKVEEEGGTCVS